MAFSPSGRSDVYWEDGKVQIGDSCPTSSKATVAAHSYSTRESHSWELNHTEHPCKVSVKSEGDKGKSIDIREYNSDKWGGLNPSKHGVCLSLDEYKRVKTLSSDIDSELKKCGKAGGGGEEVVGWHPLSDNHLLRVGVFVSGAGGQKLGVDFHELKKTNSGELKPSGKGLTISAEDWGQFKEIMPKMESKEYLFD